MGKGIERKKFDGSSLKVGIVKTRWNSDVVHLLFDRCKRALLDSSVREENIVEVEVPGAYELPSGAQHLLDKAGVDAVVVLGSLIKGETMHFEYISEAVTQGIMRLNLDSKKPVIFGVLTCMNEEQAKYRAIEEGLDHGYEWGLSAVEMAFLRKS